MLHLFVALSQPVRSTCEDELVPESAEELYQRALAAADADGRLPIPPLPEWETFPFEGEIRTRPLRPPGEEPPRLGEDPADCWRCRQGDDDAIWSDERWLVTPLQQPSGLPVIVILQPREHCDLGDLPPHLAVELGPLIVRIERAVDAVGEIGRVHVGRWGDGSAHLHFWFIARPARMPQLRTSFAAIWTTSCRRYRRSCGARTSLPSRVRWPPAVATPMSRRA
jgi:diadenosine tetraphosphate (Ap4A) HIT family hydrolase